MTMPNFLVIGAAKAGTTSLYRYLRQHPKIFMSPHKEPRFFALEGQSIDFKGPGDMTHFNFCTDINAYQALFDGVTDEKAIGEVSPWYLYVPQSAERIQHHIPNAKLIAVLRDPVDRAYSNYLHSVREQLEPLDDFELAMEAEAERIKQNWSYRWHYKQKGFYFSQIRRYFDNFDREQIKFYLFEDFTTDPADMIRDIFAFLEVDEAFTADMSEKFNVAGIPQSRLLDKALHSPNSITPLIGKIIPSRKFRHSIKEALKSYNIKPKPKLSRTIRTRYVEEYREDILKLQDLLEKDLSTWLI